jgi:hypothetical protein
VFLVADGYPAEAVGGADIITGAALRDLIDDDGATKVKRPERVIVTDRVFDFEDPLEGRVCLSESTVRAMGQLLGLADAMYVERIERDLRRERVARAESDVRYTQLAQLVDTLRVARVTVYVAPDGTEHPGRAALDAYLADHAPMPPRDIAPTPDPVEV